MAQVGLLIVAIIGYVYTVLPVFNRARLDKQIGEKQEELEKAQVALDRVFANIRRAELQSFVASAEPDCGKNLARVYDYLKLSGGLVKRWHILAVIVDKPVDVCMRELLDKYSKRGSLSQSDIKKLTEEIERAIPSLMARQRDANSAILKLRGDSKKVGTAEDQAFAIQTKRQFTDAERERESAISAIASDYGSLISQQVTAAASVVLVSHGDLGLNQEPSRRYEAMSP